MKAHFLVLVLMVVSIYGKPCAVTSAWAKEPTSASKPEAPMDPVKWRQKMQEMYKALVEITTDVSSEKRFNAPANKKRLERNVKKLSERAHEINQAGLSPDVDPTVKILSGLFQNETKRAYTALQSGNRTYARSILTQIPGYCIACHTRSNTGPSFSSLPLEPTSKDLLPMEQGRFYAATRQYDRAVDIFQKVIEDPTAPVVRPFEWEQAIRYSLAIAIRVKNDPNQASAIVEKVLESKNSPYFVKQNALKWKESIEKWKSEPPRKAVTEEGLYVEAMRLVSEARDYQKFPTDHSADILYLRATQVIHQLLQTAPDGRRAQDALLLAGLSYEVLRPLGIEDFHDIYYQACIHKAPHTTTADLCYGRYEQSVYQGYSGSMGTSIPEDVKQNLQELKKLADPLPIGTSSPVPH